MTIKETNNIKIFNTEISKLLGYDKEKMEAFEKIIDAKLQVAEEMALEYENR